jgi:Mn-dependent DtxR family transcriptional regulator
MTQRALADATGVSARNVTGLVDGLVDTGFVTREPHPSDRRAALITLTERGAATADELVREQAVLAEALFGDLPDARFDSSARASTTSWACFAASSTRRRRRCGSGPPVEPRGERREDRDEHERLAEDEQDVRRPRRCRRAARGPP